MKMIVAMILALGMSAPVSAQETKTSNWSFKQLFDTFTNRDETTRWPEGHDNYKRIDGWTTNAISYLGYKISDKDSLKIANSLTWENRRGNKNEQGAWDYTYLQYSRSKLLMQDAHFINLSGFARFYHNASSGFARGIRDTTPYTTRFGLSVSRDFTSWFSFNIDPYFQWYIRETGRPGTKTWRVAYALTPVFTITDKLSASFGVNYYYTRQKMKDSNNKNEKGRSITWELYPAVTYVWNDVLTTDLYYQVYPFAQSNDNKSGSAKKAFEYNSTYGLVATFNVF